METFANRAAGRTRFLAQDRLVSVSESVSLVSVSESGYAMLGASLVMSDAIYANHTFFKALNATTDLSGRRLEGNVVGNWT